MQGEPAFPKVQFPPADLCPLCRAPSLDNVSWQSQVFCSLLAARCTLLAAGRWLLAAGCWLLAAGCWLLAERCTREELVTS